MGDRIEFPTEWSSSLIDWDSLPLDNQDAVGQVTRTLIGPCKSYWTSEDPWERLAQEFKILRDAGRRSWHLSSPYKPYWQHLLTALALSFPERDIHPWTADITRMFALTIGHGYKGLHLIGSQSSGKSNTITALAYLLVAMDPDYSIIKVATPRDKTAGSGLFGDFRETHRSFVSNFPDKFPRPFAYASGRLVIELTESKESKMGRIEQVAITSTGAHKGVKDVDPTRQWGFIIHALDEVNEHEPTANVEYPKILSNAVSNEGFLAFSAQNMTTLDNLGGVLCEPKYSTYEELFGDGPDFAPLAWESAFRSLSFRLDGHQSPNLIAGRELYPYLIKRGNLDLLAESFGIQSGAYASQARACPMVGEGLPTVITKSRRDSSMCEDTTYLVVRERRIFAHLDPAFTADGDKACCARVKWVDARIDRLTGEVVPLLISEGPPTYFPIKADAFWTPGGEWYQRIFDMGLDIRHFGDLTKEPQVTVEDQLAIQFREYAKRYSIPFQDLSYDPSLRAPIVESMQKIFQGQVLAINYNDKPNGIVLPIYGRRSRDQDPICHNVNDEVCMAMAQLLSARSIRGGQHITRALDDLQNTRISEKAGKFKVERKILLKQRIRRSPDDRDAVSGAHYKACLAGFARSDVVNSGGGASSIIEFSNKAGKFLYRQVPSKA